MHSGPDTDSDHAECGVMWTVVRVDSRLYKQLWSGQYTANILPTNDGAFCI